MKHALIIISVAVAFFMPLVYASELPPLIIIQEGDNVTINGSGIQNGTDADLVNVYVDNNVTTPRINLAPGTAVLPSLYWPLGEGGIYSVTNQNFAFVIDGTPVWTWGSSSNTINNNLIISDDKYIGFTSGTYRIFENDTTRFALSSPHNITIIAPHTYSIDANTTRFSNDLCDGNDYCIDDLSAIGGGNASWNESYADTQYQPLSGDVNVTGMLSQYEDTTNVVADAEGGARIRQDGSGDAKICLELVGGTEYCMYIDNSAGDVLRISRDGTNVVEFDKIGNMELNPSGYDQGGHIETNAKRSDDVIETIFQAQLQRSGGVGAPGLGLQYLFRLEDDSGDYNDASQWDLWWVDPSDSAETSALGLATISQGVMEYKTIMSDYNITLTEDLHLKNDTDYLDAYVENVIVQESMDSTDAVSYYGDVCDLGVTSEIDFDGGGATINYCGSTDTLSIDAGTIDLSGMLVRDTDELIMFKDNITTQWGSGNFCMIGDPCGDIAQYYNNKNGMLTFEESEYGNPTAEGIDINLPLYLDNLTTCEDCTANISKHQKVRKLAMMDAVATNGDTTLNYKRWRSLDADTEEYIQFTGRIPLDYDGGDIEVKFGWAPKTTNSDGVDRNVTFDAINVTSPRIGLTTYKGVPAWNATIPDGEAVYTMHDETAYTVSNLEPGDVLSLFLYRRAAWSGDDYTGETIIDLGGAYMEYESEILGQTI